MKITDLSPGGYACCCYFAVEGNDAVLIDCSASADVVESALAQSGARLRAILCTHGHFDHILTADTLRQHFGVPLLIHLEDAEMLPDGKKNAYSLLFGAPFAKQAPQQTFTDGEVLTFGALSLQVIHTPGHSRGSCCFLSGDILFTGDTLFAGGYGRTDLYGGSSAALRRSLQALSALDGALRIYPGHGDSTTLKQALELLF